MQSREDDTSPQQPAASDTTQAARVLVVDDDESQWALACHWLKSLGFVAVGASSPSEAIQRMAKEPFDLLLSDIAMPGSMDGIALVRFAAARYPAMHLLLASSYSAHLLVDADLPANLLDKPYKKEDLAKAVVEAMRA